MKQIIIVFLIFILLSGTAVADGWNVTWTPISESIINKEYIIEVQNLQNVDRDVNISSFFNETNFSMYKMRDIEFYEWKLLSYNYAIDHYNSVNHSEWNATNETWHNWTESIFNYTENVELEKLDWKACKSQLFTPTIHTIKDSYGLINIPKLGSKDTGKGTYNGTKCFLLKFKTPITNIKNGYGSFGKVAILLDDVEYHPYWNTSWSNRKIITLTGGTSGAQIDYQILLNITYESGMQSDFDDLRFTNDTHELDAWLESKVDGSYALVWVEFPTTPANEIIQDYYMYYGNAGATSNWDIGATFLFGDDFSGDLSKWIIDAGSPEIIAGVLQVDGGENLHANIACSDAAWEFKVRHMQISPATYTRIFLRMGTTNKYSINDWEGSGSYGIYNYVNISWILNNAQVDDTDWHDETTTRDENSFWKCWHDTTYIGNVTDSSTTSFDNIYFEGHNAHVEYDNVRVRKYAANPAIYELGSEEHHMGSIHYNTSSPYNHTIESDGTITANRSITVADDINWTAAAVSDDCQILVTKYNLANTTIANFSLYSSNLDWLKITNLTIGKTYYLYNTSLIESVTVDVSGEINYTINLIPDNYYINIIPPITNLQSFIDETILMFTTIKNELTGVGINIGNYLIYIIIFGCIFIIFTLMAGLIKLIGIKI